MPRDARVVKELLKSMGVTEYEPRVVHQFLEVWYRYVSDVLSDAQVYSEHAGKTSMDPDDLKLAIQSKLNFSFSQPPPREVLLELARNRNKIPLPKSIGGPGIPLPPEQDTLISPNYQLAFQKSNPRQSWRRQRRKKQQQQRTPTLQQSKRWTFNKHHKGCHFPSRPSVQSDTIFCPQ
ncbi:hypothetical protein QJS10_CPB12g01785 [Acorus calamus]|uniref:Transcription initiation factor TFIID subunit 9 n=1 Tax=Acorus calamus TaxID=4465 RepID=A0AAV9DKE9_ACOCL|nr:hypothetical protein QJS10_CPB12g01785 [Acorus calamus]